MKEPRDYAEWMRRERQVRRMSTAELASMARASAAKDGLLLKLSQQSISAFEQGEAKRIPSWLKYISAAFNEDDITGGSDHEADAAVFIEQLPTYAGAGGGGTGEGDVSTVAFSRAIVEQALKASPSDLLSVTIEGNSMSPDFLSGDQILVDRRKVSIAQPGAFCLWDGDGYVIKYIERIPGSDPTMLRVISRNTTFSTFERLAEEVRIMGRVVWLARQV